MAALRRKRAFLAALLLFVALAASGGATIPRPTPALAQAAGEQFTQVNPGTLYACLQTGGITSAAGCTAAGGDVSQPGGTADANPTLGTTGYCVEVQSATAFAASGPNAPDGFTVTNGFLVDTDYFNNGSPGDASDDVYCAVVVGMIPNDNLPRPQLVLTWNYVDNGVALTTELRVNLVKVTFRGVDGPTGGLASVCTRGWDPAFLTGFASNNPPAAPNATDVVVTGDWTITGATPVGDPYREGSEWCLNVTSNSPGPIDVQLDFWAVYNPGSALDDVAHTERATGVARFAQATAPELRHVDTGGNIRQPQTANPNVVGAPHTACVMPSYAGDSLDPSDVSFTSSDGAQGTVLDVFNVGDAGAPAIDAPTGTLCFTWTSTTPGRQFVTAMVTLGPGNPTLAAGSTRGISWDTDRDGNGGTPSPSAPLIKEWYLIDRTVITTSGTPTDGVVTNGSVSFNPQANVGNNTFLGAISLNEWVYGVRPSASGPVTALIDGVRVVLTISGGCGYFAQDDRLTPLATKPIIGDVVATSVQAVTLDGRVPFRVAIDNDPGCVPGDSIRVDIDVFYPGSATPADEEEFVQVQVGNFFPSDMEPRLAWSGQTVRILYAFGGSGCGDLVATFTRTGGQPGRFVGGSANGANSVTKPFADDCSASIGYESEQPGEVDIVASFIDTDPSDGVTSGEYSKVVFPIFFLNIEDVTLSVDATDRVVSDVGSLSAQVRGWFPGTNLSTRPQETKPDGRVVPANRWVLPDDWELLKGPADFRPSWPATPSMPPARVTFFMQNEGVANSFRGGVKGGALGYFLPDGDGGEFDFNINPETRQASILGSAARPRIVSELTDSTGVADVDIFGDFNLSFQGCPVNTLTGNPYCGPGDVVGSTTLFALTDYPELRGKQAPVSSNTQAITWKWAGYKRLSVVDTPDPSVKYLVAHLKDRDGFCDAIGFNNTLGNSVNFSFDSGRNGIILTAADRPFTVRIDREEATATTFDTADDFGQPINVSITQPVLENDECQAWIKISNTLLTPINVLVTFPAPPAPLPGQLQVTALACGAPGSATVTNTGSTPVSLAGFALRSGAGQALAEEHLGLIGYLEPGQSATFSGNAAAGWVNANGTVFGNIGADYARLVWNGFELFRRNCDGSTVASSLPNPLPPDGEGEIQLDILIPFGRPTGQPLTAGWNLVTVSAAAPIAQVLGADSGKVAGIYQYDSATGAWRRYLGEAPDYVQTLDRFEAGAVYWVEVKQPFTLRLTR